MSEPQPQKSKIIIDEDWKSQVQAEKEQLERQQAEKGGHQEARAGSASRGAGTAADVTFPPASLATLVSMLATQTMAALGQIPQVPGEQPELRLGEARHFIDTLDVLDQKTSGNRTPDETAMLSQLLHELRMAYVALSNRAPPTAG